jgi:hypothetical protein
MELGGDQELIVALRSAGGDAWGGLGLYREPGARMFDAEEIRFLRAVAPPLAEGAAAPCCSPRRPIPTARTPPRRGLRRPARRHPRRQRQHAHRGHRRARPPARIAPLLMSTYGLSEREQT